MNLHDISEKEAWRAERAEQLLDTTELLNALDDDSLRTLLGDLLDRAKHRHEKVAGAAIAHNLIRARIQQEREYILREEENAGRYIGYFGGDYE